LAEKPSKERTPFTVDEYMIVLSEAIKITHEYRFHKEVRKRTKYNLDWFIWTWKFALETGLREADIISICFDRADCADPEGEPKYWDREKNMLIVTIGKTKRQRKNTKPQVNKWDLSDPKNAQILTLLEQALSTRKNVKTNMKGYQSPAKTLVHKRPVICKPSKEKVHYSAVTCKDVQETVYMLRDKIPRIAALKSAAEKPTFHEVRALFALTKWEAGWDLEVIAKALGHADVRVLLEHYGIHMSDNEELVGTKDDPDFRTKNRLKIV